ncbi:hypothetical protein CJD38_15780 [Stenotrophobium rhamnosiphilum]|uniref:DUF4124 domain-containing protein n=1 Tax=Stenotrophobium rhamnosiphilum TaxID=2029166 RepID=A0A2T5MCU2_9GAMM|nr:hypothetical protein CJD38_15780 [Stenotrophobium rhamnosiphilum]
MRVISCLLLLLLATTAMAGGKLYRYVDPNGMVHFTDQPPTRGAKPMVLDGSRPAVSKKKWDDAASIEIVRNATRFAVHWTLPTPGQTFKEVDSNFLVVVSVMPGLAKGFGIHFYVDGKAQSTKPIPDIKATLHGIGAGKHELVAALISHEGKELARSKPINIEVKATLAKK